MSINPVIWQKVSQWNDELMGNLQNRVAVIEAALFYILCMRLPRIFWDWPNWITHIRIGYSIVKSQQCINARILLAFYQLFLLER
jgi:hypothetical protein